MPDLVKRDERGSVLVLVLIAIAMLVGLTALLARSGSSTNETGDYEKLTIQVTEILRYAKGVEVAVQNLRMRGCSENQISFWHDRDGNGIEDGSDEYYNPNSPTDRSCHVFQPEGAGVEFKIPEGVLFFEFANGNKIEGVGTDCPDPQTSCTELVMVHRLSRPSSSAADIDAAQRLCNRINQVLGIDIVLDPDNLGDDTPGTMFRYIGSFRADMIVGDSGSEAQFEGLRSYCAQVNSSIFSFHQVLLAR